MTASSEDPVAVPGLVGEGHQELLARLVGRFAEIRAGRTDVARVVLLTGVSGVGKSRIVREFYRHLQQTQPTPGYWPVLPEDDAVRGQGAGVDPFPLRKVLGPATEGFTRPAGALPAFTWWTFDCGRTKGNDLLDVVAQARPDLELHLLPAMRARAEHLGAGEKVLRHLDTLITLTREAGKEGTVEGVNWAIKAMGGVPIPGLGLVLDWTARGVHHVRREAEERRLTQVDISYGGAAEQARRTLAGEFADLVVASAHPKVSAVVIVEDAHQMDTSMREFLEKVAMRDTDRPVMVIATAWPGGQRSNPDYRDWRVWASHHGNLEVWEVPDLDEPGLVELLRRAAPATTDEDARTVVARYLNTLALKLFLGLDAVRRVIDRNQRALVVASLDLAALPITIKGLYGQRIAELPLQVQRAVIAAEGTLPAGWPTGPYAPDVVGSAAEQALELPREEVITGLGHAVEDGISVVAGALHEFREVLLAEVLAEHVDPLDRAELQEATCTELRRHIASVRGDGYRLNPRSTFDVRMALWLTALIDRKPATVEDAVAFAATARVLIASYQYRLGAKFLREALRQLPLDHPDTLDARSDLATAYHSMGDHAKAIPLYEAVIADAPRVLNTADQSQTLTPRNNLAAAYREVGDLAKAIPLAKEVMKEAKKKLGPESEFTLGTRNSLGAAYRASGDLKRAAKQYKRAVRDSRRALGEDHPQTLMSRHNLAFVHLERGDRDRAIRQYKRVVKDSRRALGEDHPQTLRSRHNLAGAYGDNGDLTLAIGQLESVMRDSRRLLGDHPQTLMSRELLADTYEKAGDLKQATLEFEAVGNDFRRVWGPDDLRTLEVLHKLARAYFNNREVGRAIPVLKTLVDTYVQTVGPDHPDTLTARTDLACIYYEVGDGRAVPLLEGVLSDRERALGRSHPHTLRSRDILANAYFNAGLRERAAQMLSENLRYSSGVDQV